MTSKKLTLGLLLAVTIAFTLTSNNAYANTPTPDDLTAIPISDTEIDLTWTHIGGMPSHTQYVERCEGVGCDPSIFVDGIIIHIDPSGSPLELSYSDSGLTPDTTYGYRIFSTHGFFFGLSNTVYATTLSILDEEPPVITLIGDNPQFLNLFDSYTELGATALDDVDGDITGDIVIDSSSVNTSVHGSYSVTYNVMDSSDNSAIEVTRTVTVLDNIIPEITLIGDAEIDVPYGSVYTDLGATAFDVDDGDLTSFIVVNNPVDTYQGLTTFFVTYDVTDTSGNAAVQVIRTVNVGAKHHDSCDNCQQPSIGVTTDGRRVVDNGISCQDTTMDAQFYYTPFPLIQVGIGEEVNCTLKIWDDVKDNISYVSLELGKGKVGESFGQQSSKMIWTKNLLNGDTSITSEENWFKDVRMELVGKTACKSGGNDCDQFNISFTPVSPIVGDVVFGIEIRDGNHNAMTTFFNEGMQVGDESDVIPVQEFIPEQGTGNKSKYADEEVTQNVMTRISSNFDLIKQYELNRAFETNKLLHPELFAEESHSETNHSQ